jgi:hypothetical protein
MANGQCEFVKASGVRCRAAARTASSHCWFHDPSLARERQRARKRGGITRSHRAVTLPTDTLIRPLTSVADVLNLLEATAHEVRSGQLETRTANCVGYLCSVALNGLGQIPAQENPVRVSFEVFAPVPCPECNSEIGRQCSQCQGMGYVTAPLVAATPQLNS